MFVCIFYGQCTCQYVTVTVCILQWESMFYLQKQLLQLQGGYICDHIYTWTRWSITLFTLYNVYETSGQTIIYDRGCFVMFYPINVHLKLSSCNEVENQVALTSQSKICITVYLKRHKETRSCKSWNFIPLETLIVLTHCLCIYMFQRTVYLEISRAHSHTHTQRNCNKSCMSFQIELFVAHVKSSFCECA